METTHVEFCIDEDERIFVRGPRESMSQHGLNDANNAVPMEILKPKFMMRKAGHPTVCIAEGLGVCERDPSPEVLGVIEGWASIIVGSIPIAINAGLSHFRRGHSTIAQRAWTMTWLAFGVCLGNYVSLMVADKMTGFFRLTMYFVPAIGGFVVVAQMLMSYGSCIEMGEANF